MKINLRITNKLLLALLILSLAPLGLLGYITLDNMKTMGDFSFVSAENIGNLATNASVNALEDQTKNNLEKLVLEKADKNNLMLNKIESETRYLARYAEFLYNNIELYGTIEDKNNKYAYDSTGVYRGIEAPLNRNEVSNIWIGNQTPITEEMKRYINMSAFLDVAYLAVKKDNPDTSWIYVVYSIGMTRFVPWDESEGYVLDLENDEYYVIATPANNPDKKTVWTKPYLDPAGAGWMVTCSEPLYDKNDKFFGVQSIDLTLRSLINITLSVTVGKTGYAFMIDQNGNTIAFPNRASKDLRWNETLNNETFNLLNTPNSELKSVVQSMIASEHGISEVYFNGVSKYIAYAPINTTGWSMAIVVPISEVIEPAVNTQKVIEGHTENIANKTKSYTQNTINQILIGLVTTIMLVFLIAIVLAKSITKPIHQLTEGAKIIGSGKIDHKIKVNSRDEIGDLANSFNKMTYDLKKYMEDLRRTTAEKERIMKELEIARSIQQMFITDACPIVEDMELSAKTLSAEKVRSNFYDFVPVSNTKIGFVMAKVSGRGVSAALFMALSRSLIRANAVRNPKVADAIKNANELIINDILASVRSGISVNLFYALLDTKKKTFTYISSKEHSPFLINTNSNKIILLETNGIDIGIEKNIEFEEKEIEISRGDSLILYSDGVTKTINNHKEEFGLERLKKLIEANKDLQPKDSIEKIFKEIKNYAGEQKQSNDATLIILRDKRVFKKIKISMDKKEVKKRVEQITSDDGFLKIMEQAKKVKRDMKTKK